jgi:tRNA (cmo5U34)-methyltransferase
MSHSVERHLAVTPAGYDTEIRRYIPGYEAMLDEAAGALRDHLGADTRGHVVDLGAGTGALSERIAARLPGARLTLLDADPAMLRQAEQRIAPLRDRVALVEGPFDALPPCDAAVASLALHHLRDPGEKRAAYRAIHAALTPGGPLVIADGMLPESGPFAEPIRRRWAEHLCAHGFTEAAARAKFVEWAREDRHFPIDEELAALRESGFAAVDVRWRLGPMAVLVALRRS